MTNYEYHEQEIKNFLLKHGNTSFAVVNNEVVDCSGTNCFDCEICGCNGNCNCNHKKWLNEERNPYSIPLDTPVDTKVLVSIDGKHWEKRYFSHFEKQDTLMQYACFRDGATSWVTTSTVRWEYCKLWKEGDENND